VAVYNGDENLTHVLLSAGHTCFMSHLLVLVLVLHGLVTAGLDYNTADFARESVCPVSYYACTDGSLLPALPAQ